MPMTSDSFTTPMDTYDPVGMTPYEIRLAMVENGYTPIPLNGKAPILNEWQKTVASREGVTKWGNMGANTGMVTTTTPVLDIDILDEEAARIVETTARQC